MSQATPSLQSNLKQWLRASAPSLFQIKQRLSARRWPKKSIVIYTEKYRPPRIHVQVIFCRSFKQIFE